MQAHIDDMQAIRSFASEEKGAIHKSLIDSVSQEGKNDYPVDIKGFKIYPVLALSGGAANGAYGAGFMKGWSAYGSRPKFKVITGVSTGSIIALYAFLGSEYDSVLEKFYTNVSTKDVMRIKGFFGILMGDSVMTDKPFVRKINLMVTDEVFKKVAEEHNKGRRLLIGTVNLDAQKFVIWDMGAIANYGTPEAKKIFKEVLLASASIPVTFPPVLFKVKAKGKLYDEMHVDGGTIAQVFELYKIAGKLSDIIQAAGLARYKYKVDTYIIRNGWLSSRYNPVKNNIPSIGIRAMDTMIDAQAGGDIYKMYSFAKEKGFDFKLAYIPADFSPEDRELFDRDRMRKIFARGYKDASKGYNWHKEPPGLEEFEVI